MKRTLKIDGATHTFDAPDEMPLFWVLRDELNFQGTKFGCGIGACGACTVHVNGEATRSCILTVGDIDAVNDKIQTIAGFWEPDELHPVQQAWVKHEAPQCGYCQPGQIQSAKALLESNPKPTDVEIDEAMSGNLCRCGTYPRIRAAIHDAAKFYQNPTKYYEEQNS